MKKLLITLMVLAGMMVSCYGQVKVRIPELPAGSSIASGDLFILYQSGVTKKLEFQYLGSVLNDTADVLRTELTSDWRSEIGDSTAVLRLLIDAGSTTDTGFTRSGNYTILKHINDSVGIGTVTPTQKFEVNGN
ncbi:MAG: hypothetical protein KJ556_20865, partial [Gammaproteobacteria bacterium]|nr:hypothetical protein [Gammaproteobacteria bacterium]